MGLLIGGLAILLKTVGVFSECELSHIGLCVWILVPWWCCFRRSWVKLPRGGAWLEEVDPWGRAMRCYCLVPLPVCSLLPDCRSGLGRESSEEPDSRLSKESPGHRLRQRELLDSWLDCLSREGSMSWRLLSDVNFYTVSISTGLLFIVYVCVWTTAFSGAVLCGASEYWRELCFAVQFSGYSNLEELVGLVRDWLVGALVTTPLLRTGHTGVFTYIEAISQRKEPAS